MTLRSLLNLWFGFRAPVNRRAYAASGFALMAFKYAVDCTIVYAVTGKAWLPVDYLSPMLEDRDRAAGYPADWLVLCLAAWTVPFLWLGASMTIRRAIDAGRSPWIGLLFFIPIVNYLVMLLLCLLGSKAGRVSSIKPDQEKPLPRRDLPRVLRAVFSGVAVGLLMILAAVFLIESYGVALFIGVPFVTAYLISFLLGPGFGKKFHVGMGQLGLLLIGAATLIFAIEGLVCLLMAYPLAMPIAFFGNAAALAFGMGGPKNQAWFLIAALPILGGTEILTRTALEREVVTAIEMVATPEQVWPHLINFPELPQPDEFVFRLGIAYPIGARIEGRGVGAVRYCEFSTGPFVEPITRWEPPWRLSFDVAAQPDPMTELSPYRRVHAPHLIDGFISRRGEFRLIGLPQGRMRLEGSTWYALDIAPAWYWQIWADWLVHRIHHRVLRHVKTLAEETMD